MAFDLTTRYRGTLSGQGHAAGGHTSTGAASNSKVVVIGDINITVYTAGGEPITAADLGLTNLDCILMSVVTVDSGLPTATNSLFANYDHTSGLLLVWDGDGTPDVADTTARLRFAAFGDVAVPELT